MDCFQGLEQADVCLTSPMLFVQGLNLDAQAAACLAPLLAHVQSLCFEDCHMGERSLAMLLSCKCHWLDLTFDRTVIAAGAGKGLGGLLASNHWRLTLKMVKVVESQPLDGDEALAPFSFLSFLAPCLTHLTAFTNTAGEVQNVLRMLRQQEQGRLVAISLFNSDQDVVPMCDEEIQDLAASCPQLHCFTCQRLLLYHMQSLQPLLEMKQLSQLSIGGFYADAEGETIVTCPPGRGPMSFSVYHSGLGGLLCLPFNHFNKVHCKVLALPVGQTRQQMAEGMRRAQVAASNGPEVHVEIMGVMLGQPAPGGGLSALTTSCSLKLDSPFALAGLELEAEDILGLARAAGPTLTVLLLKDCTLTPAARALLSRSHFPALELDTYNKDIHHTPMVPTDHQLASSL
jgi:hypothetical protein